MCKPLSRKMGNSPESDAETIQTNSITEIQILQKHNQKVGCLIKIDNNTICSGADDGKIILWNCYSGGIIHQLHAHTLRITCLLSISLTKTSSKMKNYLISGSSDKTVRIWDVVTGLNIHTLTGHNGSIYCVTQHQDYENIVCSAGNDWFNFFPFPFVKSSITIFAASKPSVT